MFKVDRLTQDKTVSYVRPSVNLALYSRNMAKIETNLIDIHDYKMFLQNWYIMYQQLEENKCCC